MTSFRFTPKAIGSLRAIQRLAPWGYHASLAAVCLAAVTGASHAAEIDPGLQQRFQAHINHLADDKLEGRGVGTMGIELAAEYIVNQFTAIGLEPAGKSGTFLQPFTMTLHRELTEKSRFAFSTDAQPRERGEDFVPFSFSSDDPFDADVVFCGYGIVNKDKQFDDFADVNVNGKVVLVLMGEPPSWADANEFPTKHAMLRNKVYNAKDRGAAALLVVNQTPAAGAPDKLTEFLTEDPDEYGLPAFHITRALAAERLSAMKMGSLDEIQKTLDAGKPASAPIAHLKASGQAGFERKTTVARNVAGLLRGEGPLAEECVVIGAHYDHLGKRRPMSRTFKAGKIVEDTGGPQIHNGADDNASGVSGLIEIANLFKQSPKKPRRSVLFIAFSGEEAGLHGSKYYAANPLFPIEKTVAMLNMDMIGRVEPGKNKVEVFGVATSPDFESIVNRAGGALDLAIAPGVDEGGRSDHAPFVRSKVPAMHFFSGQHADYHKPSDDADKINSKDGARISRLVFDVAHDLANRDARPAFQEPPSLKKPDPGPLPTYRVVMGIAPSYTDDGQPGMGVDGVNAEGPADLAGIKAKDRIIRIGGKKIANIYDYMASTRENKPGDEVEVVVVRDGKEITVKVKLAGAK